MFKPNVPRIFVVKLALSGYCTFQTFALVLIFLQKDTFGLLWFSANVFDRGVLTADILLYNRKLVIYCHLAIDYEPYCCDKIRWNWVFNRSIFPCRSR